jgi:hypothetical protein
MFGRRDVCAMRNGHLEGYTRAAKLPGSRSLEQGINAHLTGEVFRQALNSGLRAVSLENHVLPFSMNTVDRVGDTLARLLAVTKGPETQTHAVGDGSGGRRAGIFRTHARKADAVTRVQ